MSMPGAAPAVWQVSRLPDERVSRESSMQQEAGVGLAQLYSSTEEPAVPVLHSCWGSVCPVLPARWPLPASVPAGGKVSSPVLPFLTLFGYRNLLISVVLPEERAPRM